MGNPWNSKVFVFYTYDFIANQKKVGYNKCDTRTKQTVLMRQQSLFDFENLNIPMVFDPETQWRTTGNCGEFYQEIVGEFWREKNHMSR